VREDYQVVRLQGASACGRHKGDSQSTDTLNKGFLRLKTDGNAAWQLKIHFSGQKAPYRNSKKQD